ncbi:MAG: glycosyltransferase family 4 protein [Sporichthyaceae bacterium]|nr:glycosyltransferase family 4 protein [Sporichthyaceae bacterium]
MATTQPAGSRRRGRIGGALRHPVRAARVLAAWYRDDPDRLAVVVSQLLPAPVARRVAPVLQQAPVRRLAPVSSVLVGLRAGRAESVADQVEQLSHRSSARSARLRTAVVLAAAERPREAAVLIAGLDPDPAVEIAKAKLDYRAGQLGAAIERVLALDPADGSAGARLLARYRSELAALSPTPVPAPPGGPDPVERTPGRILHLVTNALPYVSAGYTVRTHRIATAQRARGLDPHVVTAWGWPALQGYVAAAPEESIDGVWYHRLLPDGAIAAAGTDARLSQAVTATTRLVRGLHPAVLHAASDHRNGTVALAVRDRTGVPMVYEVRGFLEETWLARLGGSTAGSAAADAAAAEAAAASPRYELARARETAVMRSADAVVTLSATMRSEIVARGVPAERVALAPNAVDAALLTARPDGAGFRRSVGLPADAIVVGSVSTLNRYEGFATLLDAAALLRDAGGPVHVLLVGDGPERAGLARLAASLGLADLVTLPGRVPAERALAAHAALDVFVVPRTDVRVTRLVTPLKPVEAMALGRPVVASQLPALAELLEDGAAGVLVPPDDPVALATALAEFRDDPTTRERLGTAGRDVIAASRTWDRIAYTYRDLYAQLDALPSRT